MNQLDRKLEEKHVIDTYNKIADDFSDSRVWPWKSTRKFIESLEIGTKCLEVGSGNGKNMIRDDIYMVGVDSSDKLVDIAKQKNKNVLLSDGTCLPFKDNSFDSSFSIAVMHHVSTIEGRKKFIEEMIRVTKNNGPVMIEVWATTDRKFTLSKPLNETNINDHDRLVSFNIKNGETYDRYYHFFDEQEFTEMINSIKFQNKKLSGTVYFEMNNWIFIGTVIEYDRI